MIVISELNSLREMSTMRILWGWRFMPGTG